MGTGRAGAGRAGGHLADGRAGRFVTSALCVNPFSREMLFKKSVPIKLGPSQLKFKLSDVDNKMQPCRVFARNFGPDPMDRVPDLRTWKHDLKK